jgi:transposase-like protein
MESLSLIEIMERFPTEDAAREYLERTRWPLGPVCPKCGGVGAYTIKARPGSKRPARKGLYKCKQCRAQFTVTVDTIFADSHIPLNKWLMAVYLMCASKKGVSAHQLHRMLKVTYKSAWFMAHRIRYAMTHGPFREKLSGIVEVDEVYIGGKNKGRRGIGYDNKVPVLSLVQRGGKVRSFRIPRRRVTGANLKPIIREHISKDATIMTDSASVYRLLDREFAAHHSVDHTGGEYARRIGRDVVAHTNTVEGYFGLLKRGVVGTFHHVSEQHLDRYLAEFDYRYNARDVNDGIRAEKLIEQVHGKRLMYRD